MKELKIITKKTLEDAADAIRTKAGTSDPIAPEDFDDAIDAIPTGTTPTGTIQISSNGTYDVTNYASAAVAVPSGDPILVWEIPWPVESEVLQRVPQDEDPTIEGPMPLDVTSYAQDGERAAVIIFDNTHRTDFALVLGTCDATNHQMTDCIGVRFRTDQ